MNLLQVVILVIPDRFLSRSLPLWTSIACRFNLKYLIHLHSSTSALLVVCLVRGSTLLIADLRSCVLGSFTFL